MRKLLKGRFFVYFILSFLILSSCVGIKEMAEEEFPVIDVDVDIESTVDDATGFFDSYKYAVLQPDSKYPMGEIDVIDVKNDRMVIASGGTVFIYDITGKLLSCFNKRGHGPDEYVDLQDISIGENCIYVLSEMKKKMLSYDFEGRCLETYDLPYAYAALQCSDKGVWLASESDNESKYDFSLFDLRKKAITENCLPFEKYQSTFSSIRIFNPFVFTGKDEMLVVKQYDYTVYDLNDNGGNKAWAYRFNTPKQISDFGENLGYAELYQKLSHEPVVMWLGVLWKGKKHVYQTVGIFHVMSRFTNIYKFSLDNPEEKGDLLHFGLKSYEGFPFLRYEFLGISDGYLISDMPLSEALSCAKHFGVAFDSGNVKDDDAKVIFFHHFKD